MVKTLISKIRSDEIYNFCRSFLGQQYYIFSLSDHLGPQDHERSKTS